MMDSETTASHNSVCTKQWITQWLRHIMILFHNSLMINDDSNKKNVLHYIFVSKQTSCIILHSHKTVFYILFKAAEILAA